MSGEGGIVAMYVGHPASPPQLQQP